KSAPVDGILAIMGKEGESYQELLDQETASLKTAAAPAAAPAAAAVPAATSAPAPAPANAPAPAPAAVAVPASATDSRIKASPLAKKLAIDKGIDLTRIIGSGDGGRVVKRDIDWFKPGSFVAAQSVM